MALPSGVLLSLPEASSDVASLEGGASVPPFEQVYRDYFAFTWRTLRGIGTPLASLDDAAQEVWLVVHRRLGEFEGRSSLKTWVFGITLNVARNIRRSDRQRRHLVALPLDLASGSPGPVEEREGREAWELVRAFVDTLDQERREVFVCSLLEGLSAVDTAEVTGLDVPTVYHRIRALRRGLLRWAERQEHEHDP